MAKTFTNMGNSIESRPKKLVKETESTQNTRRHPVTRAVKDQEGKENRCLR